MQSEELKNPKYLEIKFYRLTTPLLNYSSLPLSGLYNPILNKESNAYQLNSKFKNFDIASPNFINIENLLSITNNPCEKILIDEMMDNFITFVNKSKEEMTIKDLKIELKLEENKNKILEKPIQCSIDENNEIKIPAKKSYSLFFNTNITKAGKYQLNISCHSLNQLYDIDYYKKKQRNTIKDSTINYYIKNNTVEFFEFQKFNFEAYNPFFIKEKFYNFNVNQCLISVKIKNITDNNLTILDLFLVPKGKNMNKIELVKSLDEIKNNFNKNDNDSKYITLQSKEELMVLFRINDPDLFNEKNEFTLSINWLKKFDFNTKTFKYDFNNSLNIFNNHYKMTITEKPEGDIIINQNFKIIINIKSKNKETKYNISLSQEPIRDCDNNSNDREIEIIDIIEKKMELSSKIQSNNFILICKSDILGSVYLPKLRFTVNEGEKIPPIENVYDSLLSFNCISK